MQKQHILTPRRHQRSINNYICRKVTKYNAYRTGEIHNYTKMAAPPATATKTAAAKPKNFISLAAPELLVVSSGTALLVGVVSAPV